MSFEPSPPPADHDPFASPTGPPAPVAPAHTELVPGWNGRRIAGGVLLVNAVTTCIDQIVALQLGDSFEPRGVLPIVFDVVIGLSLLVGQDRFLGWAIARAAIGAVLFSIVQAAQGNYCGVPMQLMVSGALLGLMIGEATKPRMIASIVVYALYLVMFFGLLAMIFVAGAMGALPPA